MTIKLSKEDWNNIKTLIDKGMNITEIARLHDISRNSIYVYGKKRGWFNKKTFWDKIKEMFKNG